jgi:hypothetical protein
MKEAGFNVLRSQEQKLGNRRPVEKRSDSGAAKAPRGAFPRIESPGSTVVPPGPKWMVIAEIF